MEPPPDGPPTRFDPDAVARIGWGGREDFDEAASAPCAWCLHKRPDGFCDAFSDGTGIPWPIREGTHRHTTPWPGDGGVLFTRGEPKVGDRADLPAGAP